MATRGDPDDTVKPMAGKHDHVPPNLCQWALVRRGTPIVVHADVWTNAWEEVTPVAMIHADAVRLAEWAGRGPGSPRHASPLHLERGARQIAPDAIAPIACVVRWRDDGSPVWRRVRVSVGDDRR